MRIISGKFRGKKLTSPEGPNTRPTSDRLRESLFNILQHKLAGGFHQKRVADIFAGTGAMGLEALSRGAAQVWLVDNDHQAQKAIMANIKDLKTENPPRLIKSNAHHLPSSPQPFDLVFLDPPYHKNLIEGALNAAQKAGWISKETLIVVELAKDDNSTIPETFTLLDERIQGKTRALFLTL